MYKSVSTRVEIAQTEMKYGNIIVTKSYDIFFQFSLSYIGYETLWNIVHDSDGIHSQPDEGSNYTGHN